MKQVVVVLDIGKTNKKIALYDAEMKLLEIYSRSFPSVAFEELFVEQVEAIEDWFLDTLREIAKAWDVQALSITTHGAASVCIGEDGLPAVPVIDYTTEIDEAVHRRFFEKVGDSHTLQKETNTPEIRPLINVGKLLFFTKERFPEKFGKVKTILFYPQYFSFRLTGNICADYTYLGCHTYLWDFQKNDWSDVAQKIGIEKLLPRHIEYPGNIAGPITDRVAERTGLPNGTPVLVGVHDSNSSLIPYLLSGNGDFLLNSTGTWCVAMHPEKKAVLKKEDIGNTVFFNLSVTNSPVKTAIFLGGLEMETWMKVLGAIHHRSDFPEFSPELSRSIIGASNDFILPGVIQGTGQFPLSVAKVVSGGKIYTLEDIRSGRSVPDLFQDYEKAYTVLLLSLALHTHTAFMRAGLEAHVPVYIEGKFRQNAGYTILLASLFPENPLFITGIDEATSFGAALLGWAAVTKTEFSAMSKYVKFTKIPVVPLSFEGLPDYSKDFFALSFSN